MLRGRRNCGFMLAQTTPTAGRSALAGLYGGRAALDGNVVRERPASRGEAKLVVAGVGRAREKQRRKAVHRRVVVPDAVGQRRAFGRLHAGAGAANARLREPQAV